MANRELNLARLRLAASFLQPLLDRLVFLGGCTTDLYITDPAAPDVRSTQDVDVIAEVADLREYYELEARMRALGFTQSPALEGPVCRFTKGELVLDVMPTDARILGFGNRWYSDAIRHAATRHLDDKLHIKVVSPVYFVATKLEAFAGRGEGDYYASHDMEDLIAVIDGRETLVNELEAADPILKQYVRDAFRKCLASRDFINALPGLIPDFHASPERETIVRERLEQFCNLV